MSYSKTLYFRNFALTNYNGQQAVDLMRRVSFTSTVNDFYSSFYKYTMNRGDRIEDIAFNYYDDVNYDWLIYHANDIIDPFYEKNFSDEDFGNFIDYKYGSSTLAKRKISHYETNGSTDDSVISNAQYQNLDVDVRKYWSPVFSAFGQAGYERSQEVIKTTTNKIISFDITGISNTTSFTLDEVVSDSANNQNRGQVVFANSSVLTLQHIFGNFNQGSDFTIQGEESEITATADVSTYYEDAQIKAEEQVYFKAVSNYDKSEELNEQRRDIFLVDEQYKEKLLRQLDDLLGN